MPKRKIEIERVQLQNVMQIKYIETGGYTHAVQLTYQSASSRKFINDGTESFCNSFGYSILSIQRYLQRKRQRKEWWSLLIYFTYSVLRHANETAN